MKIFGHDWENIKQAQQGGRLNNVVNLSKKTFSVYCYRCGKYFKPKGCLEDGCQCSHCGFILTVQDLENQNIL